MADSAVAVTPGSGASIDTRTQAGGDHRQVTVIGDATNADTAAVSSSGGLSVNGGALVNTSGNVAAGGTATIGPLSVATSGNATFTVKNQTAGTAWAGNPVLVFEQSDDGTSWSPLFVVRQDTGQVVPGTITLYKGFANTELQFDCALEGVSSIRCRVTTGPTTNPITVTIAAGGMSFPQANTVIASPSDGHKPSYFAGISSFVPFLTVSAGVPFMALQVPSVQVNRIRVVRVRLELTIATAALVSVNLQKYSTTISSGGTSTFLSAGRYDQFDPSTPAGSAQAWTAAPSAATGGPDFIALRRIWVPLATTAGAPAVIELNFAGRFNKAPILHPGSQLGWHWNGAPGTAVAAGGEYEWVEEAA